MTTSGGDPKSGPDLQNSCRVLVSLWDDGPGTNSDLSERTGLTVAQVTSAVQWLCRKRKVERKEKVTSDAGGYPYVFEALEEPVPQNRPRVVRAKSREARRYESEIYRRVGKASKQRRVLDKVPTDPLPDYVRWRDRKLALLRRLAESASADDRDILVGIINDYLRGAELPAENLARGEQRR